MRKGSISMHVRFVCYDLHRVPAEQSYGDIGNRQLFFQHLLAGAQATNIRSKTTYASCKSWTRVCQRMNVNFPWPWLLDSGITLPLPLGTGDDEKSRPN